MSPAHWHLALNHLPVVGALIAATVLAIGYWRRADTVLRLGAALAIGAALATGPVYLTGEPAEDQVEELRGISAAAIERHEDAAATAAVAVAVLGIAAAACLARYRAGAVPRPAAAALVAIALIATALFGRAANLGGQIRHPEILPAASLAAPVSGGD
jgi:hypothetical protein